MTDQTNSGTNSNADILSSSEAPTPDSTSESPVQGNVEAETPDPETLKTERVARALAQATKKERKAADRERQAANSVRAAEARVVQAEAARDELTALLTDASKNPDAALALLKKAGIPSLDALARMVLQMEPELESSDSVAKRALKEAQDLREQIKKERDDVSNANKQAQFNEMYANHLAKVNNVLDAAGEDYALVKDNNAQQEVLKRIYALLQKESVTDVSEDEEVQLVKHFAAEIEAELAPKAQSVLDRLTKIKKLGINTNNNASTDSVANKDHNSESLDSIANAVALSKKSSKFITNESTVSSKPLARTYNVGRKDDDAIQQALRAMEGK